MKSKKFFISILIILHLAAAIPGNELPALAQGTEQPNPYIEDVYPSSGPVAEETLVIITGLHFGSEVNDVRVFFRGRNGIEIEQEVVSVSDRVIEFKTKPWEPDTTGDDSIEARTQDLIVRIGEKEIVKEGAFIYTLEKISEPVVIDFDPDGGGAAGGTLVTIRGNYFLTGVTEEENPQPIYPDVYFGTAKATEIISVSVTEIVVRSPQHWGGGPVPIRIVNPDKGEAISSKEFFYKTPSATITRITPQTGPWLAENPIWVRIMGGHIPNWEENNIPFDNKPEGWEVVDVNVRAFIGDTELDGLTWENSGSLLAKAPTEGPLNQPLPISIKVETKVRAIENGTEIILNLVEESVIDDEGDMFRLVEYWDVPQILEVRNTNPKLVELGRTNEGPLTGTKEKNDAIYVIGYNFSDNMEIYFGDVKAETVGPPTVGPPEGIGDVNDGGEEGSLLPQWQRVILPPAEEPGPVTVRAVRTDDGAEGFLPQAFIYRDTNMILTGFWPKKGPVAGGQVVTIFGKNLYLAEYVHFGIMPGEILAVDENKGTSITVKTPPYGVTGTPVHIRVEDPFGSVIFDEGYTYVHGDDLTVTHITPNWDVRSGGGVVFIESEDYISFPRVFFGDTEAQQVESMPKNEVPPNERENFLWQNEAAPYVIRVVVPPGETGWTEVRVVNQMGEEITFPFYYQSQPEIGEIDPTFASVRGGNIITVEGSDFLAEFTPEGLIPLPQGASGELSVKLTSNAGEINIDTDELVLTDTGMVFRIPILENNEYPEGKYSLTITNGDGGQVVKKDAITLTWPSSQPIIEDFAPRKGTYKGGTSITVKGQNFDNPRLYIGFQEATVDEHSLLTIRAKTPPYSGERKPEGAEVKVTVINEDGAVAIAEDYFTYTFPEPGLSLKISSVFPDLALAYNENLVTITGQGFQPGDLDNPEGPQLEVFVGYEKAKVVAVRDGEGNTVQGNTLGTTIEILTPRLAPGTYDVTVINPDTSLARKEQALTFRLRETRPVITSIIPNIGPTSGGTRVIIRGEDFRPEAKVFFGTTPATALEVIDSETIIAWTPENPPGKRDVMVLNPDGANFVLKDGFEYLEIQNSIPRIYQVIPAEGPTTGGTKIRIIGQDFYCGDDGHVRVFIGYNEAYEDLAVHNIDENNFGTEITVLTPPGEPGTYDIFVFNPDGASFLLEEAFTYREIPLLPKILALEPTVGPVTGGIPVLITGENFAPEMNVYFGDQPATEVVVESETQATAWLPPVQSPQRVDVLVINPDGGSDLLEDGFEYVIPEDAPEIHALNPTWGRITGNTPVTISGTKFQPGAAVFFGSSPAREVEYEGENNLVVLTPPGRVGTVDVIVINPDGGTAILPEGFLYKDVPGPTITGIEPDRGHTSGGELVTITGTNFDPGVQVYFGTEPAIVEKEATEVLVVVTPSHDPGLVDVKVVNPDGTNTTATEAFLYYGPPRPPEDVSIFLVEDTVIGLTWQEMPGAKGYEVYGRRSSQDEMYFLGATSENYIYLTGLRPKTRYYFEIRAVNLQGASDFSSLRVSARTERSQSITSTYYPAEDIYQVDGDVVKIVLQEDHFRSRSNYLLDVSGPAYKGINKFLVYIPTRKLLQEEEGKLLLKTREIQMSIPLAALKTSSSSSAYGVISLETVQGPEKEILTALAPGQGQGRIYKIDSYVQKMSSQSNVSRFRQDIQLTFANLSPEGEPAFYLYNPATDEWLKNTLYWSKPLDLAIALVKRPGVYLLVEN